jgi:hypothetical protein
MPHVKQSPEGKARGNGFGVTNTGATRFSDDKDRMRTTNSAVVNSTSMRQGNALRKRRST